VLRVETVRDLRWPDGVQCPTCDRSAVTKPGRDETQPARQRDLGKSCERRFNDVTDPICAGQHQPLRGWLLCLYVRKLNLSNQPMAKELDRYPSAVQQLTWQ
jgi:transposase-like protein